MRFERIHLSNWKNFKAVDVALRNRMFLIGPNASGKSNFLDAFRFLRDIADPKGGLQSAVQTKRHGLSQLRSLHARRQPGVVVEVAVELESDDHWTYGLELAQTNQRTPTIRREYVVRNKKTLLDRPDDKDREDEQRLTETHLESVAANKDIRPLQEFFSRTSYLHIVPQLVREPERLAPSIGGRERDPFGADFLEQLARANKNLLRSRLDRIRDALRVAVPQLKEIDLKRDHAGTPHLKGLYQHWRKDAGWQTESQFSDGTLRLLGLLWVLLDGAYPLLLEEPELSLHPEVVRQIPSMMARLSRKSGRQLIVSTHSSDLLTDPGIAAEEVLLLTPTKETTAVKLAADDPQIMAMLAEGVSMAEAVIPRTAPANAEQLALFGS